MKQTFRFVSGVIFLVFAILLTGCSSRANKQILNNQSIIALYDQVNSNLLASPVYTLNAKQLTHTTTGNYVISDKLSQTITYSNYSAESHRTFITQDATYGNHTVKSYQQYQEGWGYWTINGINLKSIVPENQYVPSPLPPISNYQTVYGCTSGKYTYLCFYEPSTDAQWAIPQGCTIQDATAMLVLTKDGKLLNWQTSLTYHQADTTVYTRVFAAPSTDHGVFDLTTQDAEFMEVSSLDAVVMLERFSGFLSSVEPISADMVHTITCDANNLERIQTTKIELSGKKENFSATVDTTVVTTDHSRNDIITNEYQIENFSNNTYALDSSNLHKESPDVTYDVMNSYCRNNLVVTLPLLQYIQDARIYNQDGKTLYRFPGTQELSELICSEACNLLYQDPGYLDALASDRNILSTECTLRIHPLTGLPESSSIVYRGTHTIEGKVYNFTSTTVQNYHFS